MRMWRCQLNMVTQMVCVILLVGCMHNPGKTVEVEEDGGMDIGIQNVGKERIDRAYVKVGDYCFRAGIVSPGTKKVHVSSGQSAPDKAEIGYQLSTGKEVVRVVSVKAFMPTNNVNDLALYFNIDGEKEVRVEFLHFIQVDGKWQLAPCEPP